MPTIPEWNTDNQAIIDGANELYTKCVSQSLASGGLGGLLWGNNNNPLQACQNEAALYVLQQTANLSQEELEAEQEAQAQKNTAIAQGLKLGLSEGIKKYLPWVLLTIMLLVLYFIGKRKNWW